MGEGKTFFKRFFPPPNKSSILLISAHLAGDVFCHVTSFDVFAFVVELFAFAKGDFHFGFSFGKVHFGGDDGVAFLVCLGSVFFDFRFVHEQAAWTFGVVLEMWSGLVVRGDVDPAQEGLPVSDVHVAVFERELPGTQGFDFGAFQADASLQKIFQMVVVAGFLVDPDGV